MNKQFKLVTEYGAVRVSTVGYTFPPADGDDCYTTTVFANGKPTTFKKHGADLAAAKRAHLTAVENLLEF